MKIAYVSIAAGLPKAENAACLRKQAESMAELGFDAVFLAMPVPGGDEDKARILSMMPRCDEAWLFGPDAAFPNELKIADLCGKLVRKFDPKHLAVSYSEERWPSP